MGQARQRKLNKYGEYSTHCMEYNQIYTESGKALKRDQGVKHTVLALGCLRSVCLDIFASLFILLGSGLSSAHS